MTTYRMYRCNLCGDFIQPTESTAKEGFGVYFGPGSAPIFKSADQAEKHICRSCAKGVHDELRKGYHDVDEFYKEE